MNITHNNSKIYLLNYNQADKHWQQARSRNQEVRVWSFSMTQVKISLQSWKNKSDVLYNKDHNASETIILLIINIRNYWYMWTQSPQLCKVKKREQKKSMNKRSTCIIRVSIFLSFYIATTTILDHNKCIEDVQTTYFHYSHSFF